MEFQFPITGACDFNNKLISYKFEALFYKYNKFDGRHVERLLHNIGTTPNY